MPKLGQLHQDKTQAVYDRFQRIKKGIPAPGSEIQQNLRRFGPFSGLRVKHPFPGNKKGPSPRALFLIKPYYLLYFIEARALCQ
jgi:hypothetical protein